MQLGDVVLHRAAAWAFCVGVFPVFPCRVALALSWDPRSVTFAFPREVPLRCPLWFAVVAFFLVWHSFLAVVWLLVSAYFHANTTNKIYTEIKFIYTNPRYTNKQH